jgi:hypothetical protein
MTPPQRPLLGDIKPGDPVIVTDPDRNGSKAAAHVVKAARVWIEIKADDSPRKWRMRRDTQNENTGFGFGGHRFATTAQHAWDQRFEEAHAYLTELGIKFRPGSLWSASEKRIQLADLIRATTEETR